MAQKISEIKSILDNTETEKIPEMREAEYRR